MCSARAPRNLAISMRCGRRNVAVSCVNAGLRGDPRRRRCLRRARIEDRRGRAFVRSTGRTASRAACARAARLVASSALFDHVICTRIRWRLLPRTRPRARQPVTDPGNGRYPYHPWGYVDSDREIRTQACVIFDFAPPAPVKSHLDASPLGGLANPIAAGLRSCVGLARRRGDGTRQPWPDQMSATPLSSPAMCTAAQPSHTGAVGSRAKTRSRGEQANDHESDRSCVGL